MPRLSQLAKSFQRVRYHRLRFEVVAAFPSVASGAYCAGFVKDATDPIKAGTAGTTLLASGGTATKVWQSTEVIVNNLPGLFYTSAAPNSERWSSPGSFVIDMLAENDQQGSYQVYVHWDVTLTQPTYETPEQPGDDGFATAQVPMYTSNDNKYLSVRDGNSWRPAEAVDFSPALKSGDKVRFLAHKFGLVENASSAIDSIFGFNTVLCYSSSGKLYIGPVDEQDNRSTLNFHGETYCIAEGEKGELQRKAPNLTRGSWYLSPRTAQAACGKPKSPFLRDLPCPRQEPRTDCSTSSSSHSSQSTAQANLPLFSETCTQYSETLQTSSERQSTSQVEALLKSLVSQMEHLFPSQARSQDSQAEEFEMVEIGND